MSTPFCSKEFLLELARKVSIAFDSPELISVLEPDELARAESLMSELADDLARGVCRPSLVDELVRVLGIADWVDYGGSPGSGSARKKVVDIDYGDEAVSVVVGTLNRAVRVIREYVGDGSGRRE